jgi:hypothetical protein
MDAVEVEYAVQFLLPVCWDVIPRHLKSVSALPRTTGSSTTPYPSVLRSLQSSACCYFFSVTLSMYLVSENNPSSMIHILLGLPHHYSGIHGKTAGFIERKYYS